jgi:N-acetylglucosaminyldiphosphoundecaprenol N-acetyl-beta-D-mannosaminyltransferase
MNIRSSKVVKLFGIPINAMTMAEVLALVHQTIAAHSRLQIGVVNVAKVVNMRRNKILRDDVLASDIILADGSGVVLACRLLGQALPERVPGIDLMFNILKQGDEQGYRVHCFGATEEINQTVAGRIREEYPNVKVVGRRNGYFSDQDEKGIAKEIALAEPDVLFVAMSPPKKEKFMARWGEAMGVPVCHGVGGSFDVMAGKTQRAPEAWQRAGLEWLYRVKEEPRRMWKRYLVTNTLFAAMLAGELVRHYLRFKSN